MIDKTHRFQGHGSLRFVYQKGQTVRGPFSALKYAYNRRRDTFRMAVVVSRKVHKSAVVRNRIRRRVYEVVRLQTTRIQGPFDIVFIAYNEQLASMPAEQLRLLVNEQLEKARIVQREARQGPGEHAIVDAKES